MSPSVEHFRYLAKSEADVLPSDGELLERIRIGEDEALSQLYDRHSSLVYAVALRVLRSASAAEDVVQEIFLQIWRMPPELREGSCRLNGWMAIVTRNRCLDLIREQTCHPSVSTEDFDVASSEDLGQDAERHEMYEKAGEIAGTLPVEQQQILHMCFVRGMTHSAVAQSTGLPLGTIKTRVRSALHTLRDGLEAGYRRS
jgi:RNA polymerase sigma-70 factor (ECF subfamily)